MPAISAAIVAIVLLNGGFAFWQEYRADRSGLSLNESMLTGESRSRSLSRSAPRDQGPVTTGPRAPGSASLVG